MPVIRPLLPAEGWRYRTHLLRLDPADRHSRFMGTLGEEAILSHVRRLDWRRTTVLAAIIRGEVRAAAELCRGSGPQAGMAELAVSVERGWQGLGLGVRLTEGVLTIARNRGVAAVTMVCLPENRRMRRIAARLVAGCRMEEGEVTAQVPLAPGSPLTWAQEAVANATLPMAIFADQWLPAA